ncbi:MAG: hypothetical protein GEU26_13870 [Nitrososphaeraceae archaeon]|nr:hypothetical protein [Nitrososphaeraceae archaeon]
MSVLFSFISVNSLSEDLIAVSISYDLTNLKSLNSTESIVWTDQENRIIVAYPFDWAAEIKQLLVRLLRPA